MVLQGLTQEEEEEKRKQEAFIAMMEGIAERVMDKRMGNPVPTFFQQKQMEKMHKKETYASKLKAPQQTPRKENAGPPKEKVVPATNLNPPARPARARITAVEKVSLNILPPSKNKGGKKGKKIDGENTGNRTDSRNEKTDPRIKGAQEQSWTKVISKKKKKEEKNQLQQQQQG